MNKLEEFSHVLTGYVGSSSFLEQLCKSIQDLKRKNPNLVYGESNYQSVHCQIATNILISSL